ncbi:MFS transporter [Mycolicibacterium smegmatis]|uniref:MFS transporter n=1 Tax=Mycolicibacterium smegmatis TaxID=1772 RepID=UPI001303C743|nr:MFS transporter [Mycolicibacterium smegmatis]
MPTVLGLCWAALTLEGYDIVVYGAAVPYLLRFEPWGLGQAEVGLLGSVALLGMLVGALLAGIPADRWGRRPTLIAGVVVVGVGMLVCAVAPTPVVFAMGRLLVGLGAGAMLPAASALVAEVAPPERRNLYQGLVFGGIGAGGLLSALAALALAESGGFRILFLVGAVPPILLIPAMVRWLPEPTEFSRSAAAPVRETSWRRLLGRGFIVRTGLFWATTFLSLLVLFGAYTWLPVLMIRAGYSLGTSLVFLMVLNIGVMIGSVAAPWAADRRGARTMILAAFGTGAVGFTLLAMHPPGIAAYVLVAVIGAGTVNAQFLLNALIAASHPTELRATALGAALGLGRLGGVVGPLYGSQLITEGVAVTVGFYGFALPAAMAGALSLALPKAGRELP